MNNTFVLSFLTFLILTFLVGLLFIDLGILTFFKVMYAFVAGIWTGHFVRSVRKE